MYFPRIERLAKCILQKVLPHTKYFSQYYKTPSQELVHRKGNIPFSDQRKSPCNVFTMPLERSHNLHPTPGLTAHSSRSSSLRNFASFTAY